MHILKFFIKYSILVTLLLLIVGGLTREGLLFWGVIQVRSAENKMEVTAGATKKADYDQECRKKSGAVVQLTQLRFISDTEYRLEVVCGFFANDPIVIESFKLPPFVKKSPGQAGFVSERDNMSGVVLEVYGRKTGIVLDKQQVSIIQGTPAFTGKQPQASCQGFGYMCCTPETHIGVDDVFSQVSDCPQTCYSSCKPRPLVLKFTSDPNPDLKTRTARVAKNTPITFYYVTDPGQGQESTTELKFGDGKSERFTDSEGNFTYQYQCTQAECQYSATLLVTDVEGETSVSTPVSTITVIVK